MQMMLKCFEKDYYDQISQSNFINFFLSEHLWDHKNSAWILLWPLYLYVEDTSSRNNYLKELYFQKKYKEKKRILYQLIYDHSFKSLAKL